MLHFQQNVSPFIPFIFTLSECVNEKNVSRMFKLCKKVPRKKTHRVKIILRSFAYFCSDQVKETSHVIVSFIFHTFTVKC